MTDPTDPGPTDPGPTDKAPPRSPATRVQHPPLVVVPADNRPLNAPIQQNVKWDTPSVAEAQRIARGERAGFYYSRMANPGTRQLELLLAELQGREDCLTCASGINAVAQVLLALTGQGDHVVSFVEGYGPTRQLLRGPLTRFGVAHTLLPLADHAGLAAGGRRDASLRIRRPAGVSTASGPSGDVPGVRAEVERLVEEIKQSVGLLRRHL